jgi:hypothetical protein
VVGVGGVVRSSDRVLGVVMVVAHDANSLAPV